MSLFKAITGIVVLPLDVVTDVVNAGSFEEKESAVKKRCKHIGQNIDELTEPPNKE